MIESAMRRATCSATFECLGQAVDGLEVIELQHGPLNGANGLRLMVGYHRLRQRRVGPGLGELGVMVPLQNSKHANTSIADTYARGKLRLPPHTLPSAVPLLL